MENKTDFKSNADASFDRIIGYIEDILMEPKFSELQNHFLEKYWSEFDSVEENKLIYMEIFEEYHKAIESYIENSLSKTLPDFTIESLIKQLSDRGADLDGEVFDVLFTFTDFLAFKDMILDYRAMKEGKVQDLSSGIFITHL